MHAAAWTAWPGTAASTAFPVVTTATANMNVASVAAPQAVQAGEFPMSMAYYGSQSVNPSWTTINTQQQWQQWEQWQQQYTQWHQQYGEKYQAQINAMGLLSGIPATSGVPPPGQVPPLPTTVPVQPPLPVELATQQVTVQATPLKVNEKVDDSAKRPLDQADGKDDAKKLKTDKSTKSGKPESLQELLEAEKAFDEQFKSWEDQFLKWKEQNANHPDKTQYLEYEKKWDTWREQLHQKREVLKKKREAKEAEIAQAAVKEAQAIAAATAAAAKTNTKPMNSMMPNDTHMYSQYSYHHSASEQQTSGVSQVMPESASSVPGLAAYSQSYSLYSQPLAGQTEVSVQPPTAMIPPVSQLPFINQSAGIQSLINQVPSADQQAAFRQSLAHSLPSMVQPPPTTALSTVPPLGPPPSFGSGGNIGGLNKENINEFLKGSSSSKTIPGLDLVVGNQDKDTNVSLSSTIIPPCSSLFSSFTQDLNKPLHTSDDKPFNFPVPKKVDTNPSTTTAQHTEVNFSAFAPSVPPPFGNQQNVSYPPLSNQQNVAYPIAANQQNVSYPQLHNQQTVSYPIGANQANVSYPTMSNQQYLSNHSSSKNAYFNIDKGAQSSLATNDQYRRRTTGYDNNASGKPPSGFNNESRFSSNSANSSETRFSRFSEEKYAKYLEDEYDDSRFRDPEDEKMENSFYRSNRNNDYGYSRRGGPDARNDNYKSSYNSKSGINSPVVFDYHNSSRFGKRDNTSVPPPSWNQQRNTHFGQFNESNKEPYDVRHSRFSDDRKNKLPGPSSNKESLDGNIKPFAPPDQHTNKLSGPPPTNKEFDGNIKPLVPPEQLKSKPLLPNKELPVAGIKPLIPPDQLNKLKGSSYSSKDEPPASRRAPDAENSANKDSSLQKKDPPKLMSLMDVPIERPPILDQPKSNVILPSLINQESSHPPTPKFPAAGPPEDVSKKPTVPFESNINRPIDNSTKPPIPPVQTTTSIDSFDPSKIYDYTYMKGVPVTTQFETDYIFDYSHGGNSRTNSSADKTNTEKPWDGEPWTSEDKKFVSRRDPLPPRGRREDSKDKRKSESGAFGKQENDSVGKGSKDKIEDSLKKLESEVQQKTVLAEDLLCPPGRNNRPPKIVLIFRGPPGSGKTYAVRLIKEKEVEMGGNTPRILSLNDYFETDVEKEVVDSSTGKKIIKKEVEYVYDERMAPLYQESLRKAFKKTVSEGFFPFIIVDCVNDKISHYEEMYSFAKVNGFQVYIVEMDMDVAVCTKRNIHKRIEAEISTMVKNWEKTPANHNILDMRSLLQSAAITDVDMEDVNDDRNVNERNASKSSENKDGNDKEKEKKSEEGENEENLVDLSTFLKSKWDQMDNDEEKLDRLDGIKKKKCSTTIKEWLEEGSGKDLTWYTSAIRTKGKKNVRWADLEEIMAQEKMRAIGFVVGQTDWKRMMDPTSGENKLNQTKYI